MSTTPYNYTDPAAINLQIVSTVDPDGKPAWAYKDADHSAWPILGEGGTEDKTITVTVHNREDTFNVYILPPVVENESGSVTGAVKGVRPDNGWKDAGNKKIAYEIDALVGGYDFVVSVQDPVSKSWSDADPTFTVKKPPK